MDQSRFLQWCQGLEQKQHWGAEECSTQPQTPHSSSFLSSCVDDRPCLAARFGPPRSIDAAGEHSCLRPSPGGPYPAARSSLCGLLQASPFENLPFCRRREFTKTLDGRHPTRRPQEDRIGYLFLRFLEEKIFNTAAGL